MSEVRIFSGAYILSAAIIVFSINAQTVIGPTPPGTGVIAEAFSDAVSKSTSPHNLPSMLCMPTSITIAPDGI